MSHFTSPRVLTPAEIEAFLINWHGLPITGLEPLSGGFWATAYAYIVEGEEFVVRFAKERSGFDADRIAMAFDGPNLPVPKILDIGAAFDGAYAISIRHYGRFLESVLPDEANVVGSTILNLLSALYAMPSKAGPELAREPASSAQDTTWRRWLTSALIDDPRAVVHGWRSVLASDRSLDQLFRACQARIQHLVEGCPERKDLVHGDLLHSNVLVSADASQVTAVFSWKCALRGDFLFDTAWCTFWGAYHPGIAAADIWGRVLTAPWATAKPDALLDASVRHHCYELQIGVTHLAWNAWNHDEAGLNWVAEHTAMILERGPLPAPTK